MEGALAAFHRIDFLLTWNCRHIANGRTRRAIDEALKAQGMVSPIVVTPEELPEENCTVWIDPIIEEVRKNREEFAAQFNFDLRAMGKALQEMERASGRQVVSFAPQVYRGLSEQEGQPPRPKGRSLLLELG